MACANNRDLPRPTNGDSGRALLCEPTMAQSEPTEGVYLSSVADLERQYGDSFAAVSRILRLRSPAQIRDPSCIRFALAWEPADAAFAAYPNLKMVCSIGAGVDGILKCSSLPSDVFVTRVRDAVQAYTMAGFVVWHVVWHHRRMGEYLASRSEHKWRWVESVPVTECTVGVLGLGTMGRAIALALRGLGYRVIVARRTACDDYTESGMTIVGGPNSVEVVASRADLLVNVLPLTAETQSILNAKLFAAMSQGSVLIQVGRGAHLVHDDFMAALDNGILSAASLDVFVDEPLPPWHPYWHDARLLITPHIACESDIGAVVSQVAGCVEDIAQSRPPRYAISREKGY